MGVGGASFVKLKSAQREMHHVMFNHTLYVTNIVSHFALFIKPVILKDSVHSANRPARVLKHQVKCHSHSCWKVLCKCYTETNHKRLRVAERKVRNKVCELTQQHIKRKNTQEQSEKYPKSTFKIT